MMGVFRRVTEKERSYIMEVLDGEFRKSVEGRMTEMLEKKFAGIFGVKYAISHVNGTVTMHSALVAAGVGPGDEVIVPALTMASTAFSALYANAKPVFADVSPDTFTIDPEDVRKLITPRTRAIIPVSLYGLSPDMDPIMELAEEHDLTIIEDNAECVLGYYKNRIVGSMGDMASFSFQSSKHLTSGEGGILITDNEELALKARRFSNLGFAPTHAMAGGAKMPREKIQDPKFERHLSLGWNYRLSELCAAVALAQTERIREIVNQRIRVAEIYRKAVSGCSWLIPQHVPKDCIHSYWTYVMRLEDQGKFTWYDFRKKYLEFGGDGFYAAWVPVHLEPVFRSLGYGPGLCPVTETLQPKLIQMKTNYGDLKIARQKADALSETIDYFEKNYHF
jgi:perosamine synthetase